MTDKKPKKRGQHKVFALVRVYDEGAVQALEKWATSKTQPNTVIRELKSDTPAPTSFNYQRGHLFEINWLPTPSANSGNTRHAFQVALRSNMRTGKAKRHYKTGEIQELYYFSYDILDFDGSWEPVD